MGNNELSEFDVSFNTALEYLYIENNDAATLDVSKNTLLKSLNVENNKLATLDLSCNKQLYYLNCIGNKLTSLDLSANNALEYFYAENNALACLDLSANTKIKMLSYNNQDKRVEVVSPRKGFKFDVSTIVDDMGKVSNLSAEGGELGSDGKTVTVYNDFAVVSYSYEIGHGTDLMEVNIKLCKEKSVSLDEVNFPDEKFRNYLSEEFDVNGDGILSADEIFVITEINVNGKGISTLKGIENFTRLESLYAASNNLTKVDLTQNTALKTLNLSKIH